jgi:TRAP-type C4-dicarboxylate transport system permease small subunit
LSDIATPSSRSVLLRTEHWAAFVAGIGVLIMMLLGGIDVITTKAFSWPIPGAYEITETTMVASVFLALALSQREKRQIRVELFTERLGPRSRRGVDALAELCSLVVYLFIAWYGVRAAWTSVAVGDYGSGAVRLPLWPAKLALALGSVLMCLECARGVIDNVRSMIRPRG